MFFRTFSDDDEFRFNDASTHEGHLRQNGELTWFCSETIIMISHKCIKCKTRTKRTFSEVTEYDYILSAVFCSTKIQK